jgi:hypothetical protein
MERKDARMEHPASEDVEPIAESRLAGIEND